MTQEAGDRNPMVRRWVRTGLTVLLFSALTIAARAYYAPVLSGDYPGMFVAPTSRRHSDPPSMDELWHLALTVGWGELMLNLPPQTVLRDVPSLTSLDDARPWYTVWTSMEHVIHPPLYVQTLRLWREVFGSSDVVAVAYSVMWSCVAVCMVFLATRLIAGTAAAWWAAIVMAIAPTQIYFGLEIRAYAMVTAICGLLLWQTQRMWKDGVTPKSAALFAGTALAAALTHYLTWPVCIVAGLVALVAGRRGQRRHLVIAAAAAMAVYAVIWFPFLLEQYRQVSHPEQSFIGNATGKVWDLVRRTVMLPLRLINESFLPRPWHFWGSVVLLAAIVYRAYRRPALRPAASICIGGIALLLLQDALQQTQLIAFIRYAASFTPAVMAALFGTFALSTRGKHQLLLHVAGVIAVVGCLVTGPLFPIRQDSVAYFAVAERLGPLIGSDQTLVIYSRTDFANGGWWVVSELSHVPHLFPRDVLILKTPADAELMKQIRSREVWLVDTSQFADPEQLMPGCVVQQGEQIELVARGPRYMAYRLLLPAH